ncbi:MAG: hypothetical protein GOU99_03580 [Candidatus Altiarchaeota archaeon]|nr:hypothetical protein [Candidatus Altiarchaeota archaeon]
MTGIINQKLCLRCKGKLWCGLNHCPVYERMRIVRQTKFDKNISAPTPPFHLVSWKGYPNINVGPYLVQDRASEFASSSKLFKLDMQDLLKLRASAIRPYENRHIRNTFEGAAMSVKPVEMSAELSRTPIIKEFDFSFLSPAAPATSIKLEGNPKVPSKVEKFHSDYDAKAEQAVWALEDRYEFDYLVQLMSSGSIGIKSQRKLVPTRWAITATDSIIAKKYFLKVRSAEPINKFELFTFKHWDNLFVVLLIPWGWGFEILEKWMPGSAWGQGVVSDYEYGGLKKGYASNVTGSYYAARLELLKYLADRKRRAACVVFREIGPDYFFPVGVWHVRETIKATLESRPERFDDWNSAMTRVGQLTNTEKTEWAQSSKLIHLLQKQTQLSGF